jgi:hypothetical protein
VSAPIGNVEQPEARQSWTKALLKIALIAAALLVSLWVTAFAAGLTVFAAYKRCLDNFSQVTGLDPYLAIVVFLLLLVPFFIGARFYLFSPKKINRRTGLAILLALGVLYNAGLYFAARDQSLIGMDRQYYALVPGGVVFSARPGTEPRSGVLFRPMTADKIRWLLRIQKGQIQAVPNPALHDWFDSVTRDPLLWYYTDSEGIFRFFDGPGYAPATGDELKAVNPDVRQLWERKSRGEHLLEWTPQGVQSPQSPKKVADGGKPKPTPPPATTSTATIDQPPTPAPAPVGPAPSITSFQAVPNSVAACKPAILRWTVNGAASVAITPGIGPVDPAWGYKVVLPLRTTQYTLEAKGPDGSSASHAVTVTVSGPPTSTCAPQ